MPRPPAQTSYPAPRITTAEMPLKDVPELVATAWRSGALGAPAELAEPSRQAVDLIFAAMGCGVQRMEQLVGAVAREVVADVAGVPQLGATLTVEQRERVRLARNTLLALHATVAQFADGALARVPLTDLPKAPNARALNHSCRKPRPCTADEVLLARLHFYADTRLTTLRSGNAYALLEAGMTPRDISAATAADLRDQNGQPTTTAPVSVLTEARARRGSRELKLTGFGAALLARNLQLMVQAQVCAPERLTFVGAAPGTDKAGISVQGYLNDHIAWAGVEDRFTNVRGVALWRQRQLLDTDGLRAALDCAFGDLITGENDRYHELAARLLRHLHVTQDQSRRAARG